MPVRYGTVLSAVNVLTASYLVRTMNCRHCDKPLPDVRDAFCPHCRGELADVEVRQANARPSGGRRGPGWIPVLVAAGLALLVLPLLTFPLAGLVFIAFVCIRAAIANRKDGWIVGLIIGVTIAVAGLA